MHWCIFTFICVIVLIVCLCLKTAISTRITPLAISAPFFIYSPAPGAGLAHGAHSINVANEWMPMPGTGATGMNRTNKFTAPTLFWFIECNNQKFVLNPPRSDVLRTDVSVLPPRDGLYLRELFPLADRAARTHTGPLFNFPVLPPSVSGLSPHSHSPVGVLLAAIFLPLHHAKLHTSLGIG